jgi:hypothetical protein
VKKQKPRWRLRTRATRRQTTAAAAIDSRQGGDRQHRVGGDRQDGDRQGDESEGNRRATRRQWLGGGGKAGVLTYGWIPHNAGFGFLDLAPSILHSNWF